jgi:uncharacterized protein (TIGR00369 family)
LLDSACGCAIQSCLTATQAYRTLELKVAYHKAITKDIGLLRADGHVLSLGRRCCVCRSKAHGCEGGLFASATSTLLLFER